MIINLSELRRQLIQENAQLTRPLMSEFDFANDDPRHMPRLSLEQQKKRAKELLKLLKAQEPNALARAHDVGEKTSNAEFTLAKCQKIIAKEFGFSKWTDLKNHIEYASLAQQAIENGQPTALDHAKQTLHIRCGTDIQHPLAISGFCGDFLAFADPYCQGPVIETSSLQSFIDTRVNFISDAYQFTNRTQLQQRIEEEYSALETAKHYQRVNIWLEHDSYDQLILAKLLDHFSLPDNRPKQIQLITVESFPGVKVFNGIGQLPPDAFRVLWKDFKAITEEQFTIGKQTWRALKMPNPELLLEIALSKTPALKTISKAVARHLQELPSTINGLSLVEELTLKILADKGPMNAARLFGWYTNHYEPLTFLGDTQYWDNINRLTQTDSPALRITKANSSPKNWQVEATDIGMSLLAGSIDWLDLAKLTSWVGGVKINPKDKNHWRINRLNPDDLSLAFN